MKSLMFAPLIFCTAAALAAPPGGFEGRVENLRKDIGVPGMAIAIVENDQVTMAKGFGVKRLGASVSLSKNRLRSDAVNFIFGAHLGFDAGLCRRQTCVFVNLEQLGEGGAQVSVDYLKLLASSAVVDYDAGNLASYAKVPEDVPLVPFLYAPYLANIEVLPLEERPIDLLFFGSMNPRRRAWLDRIEVLGYTVSVFDAPLYGPERDSLITQAKVVLNAHFYETSRFEQARVSHCLSLGTPVISERTAMTRPHPAFEDSVLWLQGDELEQFFSQDCGTQIFYDTMREAVERFRSADPIEAYAELLSFASGFSGAHRERRDNTAWCPGHINLAAGNDYRAGWLNIDTLARSEPDLRLDLAQPLTLPMSAVSALCGPVELAEGGASFMRANSLPMQVSDLGMFMSNCLRLLAVSGEMHIEVPYANSPAAWLEPTQRRAMNEYSWIAYTDSFWMLGWFEHRFDLVSLSWVDIEQRACEREHAAFMLVTLRKVETTLQERTLARTMQADFGGLPQDAVEHLRTEHPDIDPAVESADESPLRSAMA